MEIYDATEEAPLTRSQYYTDKGVLANILEVELDCLLELSSPIDFQTSFDFRFRQGPRGA